jgi:hypothetical protein
MNKKLSILLAVLALLIVNLACASGGPAGVSNLRMSKNSDGSNPTTTFAPTDKIYALFDVNQVKSGAKLQIKWFAVDVQGQDPTQAFAATDYAYNNESTIVAHVESTKGGFPVANYRVEIYLDGAKVGEQTFNVQ